MPHALWDKQEVFKKACALTVTLSVVHLTSAKINTETKPDVEQGHVREGGMEGLRKR